MKDHGVIVIHHADSFCEPIVEDMVDIGIDVWQGVLPENDIVKLQKQLDGRMTLMGGIDATIDRERFHRGGDPGGCPQSLQHLWARRTLHPLHDLRSGGNHLSEGQMK